MKRIILFCCIVCIAICGYARHDVIYICQGEVYYWDISEYATPSDTLVYASGTIDWTFFYQEAQYDTVLGNQVILSPSVDRAYKLISINGSDTMMGDCPIYLTIHIKTAPTISIPPASIHHVTCPDGAFYPYMDGVFHVSLDDSVQNYAWINIQVDTPFFFVHTCYDSVTLTGLRAGIYKVSAYGINGCVYSDNIIIEQPEAWGFANYSCRSDTVCHDSTGCLCLDVIGGTPPYIYTWFYYSDTGQVFLEYAEDYVCGLYSGIFYQIYMHDSRGCKAFGDEIEFIATYLYEWVEDSIQILTVNPTVCYGSDTIIEAQSVGYGHYVWHVGDIEDTLNYSTWVPSDSVLIAGYFTPQIIEPTLVSVDFYDQHNCVTHDSVWIEVYNPDVSFSIITPTIVTDSICTVHVSPSGGNLYLDEVPIAYNIPENFTFSTAGISVGEHVLKYAGTFGGELGLACEDEVSIPIQVDVNPLVPNWEYEISIYPNPATTTLNLSSTEIMDFTLSITDIAGRVILKDKILDSFHSVDVSNLTAGMYLLRLASQDGATKTVKFVKR